MRHTFLVVTVKRWLKSVYIYGRYRKIKTGVPLFLDHPVYKNRQTVYKTSAETAADVWRDIPSIVICQVHWTI